MEGKTTKRCDANAGECQHLLLSFQNGDKKKKREIITDEL
jgi:hypothetical protein